MGTTTTSKGLVMKNLFILSFVVLSLNSNLARARALEAIKFCGHYKDESNIQRLNARIEGLHLKERCLGRINNSGVDYFCQGAMDCEALQALSCAVYGDMRNVVRFENAVSAMNALEEKDIVFTKICYEGNKEGLKLHLCEAHVSSHCEEIKAVMGGVTKPEGTSVSGGLKLEEVVGVFNTGFSGELFNDKGIFDFLTPLAPEGVHLAGLNTNNTSGTIGGLKIPIGEKYLQFVSPINQTSAVEDTLNLLNDHWGDKFSFSLAGSFITTLKSGHKIFRFGFVMKEK